MSGRNAIDHPDEIRTASYLDGQLRGELRDQFEAHLAECESCRQSVVQLRAAHANDGGPVPEEFLLKARALKDRPRRILGLPRGLGIAASLALGVGIAAWMVIASRPPREEPSVLRGEAGSIASNLVPSAGTTMPGDALRFRWPPVEGADRYEVLVFDSSGSKVLEIPVGGDADTAPWPADFPRPAPGSYVWRLRALALDRVLVESEAIPFEIGP